MVHLIVGNTGAGKTTYAQKLRSEQNAVVFSIDKWNKELFLPDRRKGDGLDWFLERITRSETVIMDMIIQLEAAGADSILDLGFSRYNHREKFRSFAAQNTFDLQLHYLDVPMAIRHSRVKRRNQEKGESFEFEVSQEELEFMEGWFEEPHQFELEKAIIIEN